MTQQTKHQGGFTIVETTIALSFVTFILLFVVFAIMEVMGTYSKGLAVKEISQTARTNVEEIARTLRSTKSDSLNIKNSDHRACLGGVSYVWNIKNDSASNRNKFTDESPIYLVRVDDPSGSVCATPYGDIDKNKSIELLNSQVWVQNMQIKVNPNKKLVEVAMVLSTSGDNAPTGNSLVTGPVCQGGKPGNYCAVAQFNTIVSIRNGGN